MKKFLLSFSLILCLLSAADSAYGQSVWYIRRTPPEPWTWAPILNDNITEMDAVFGVGGWNSGYFSTVDPAVAFGPTSTYVFLEGGDDHAIDLNNFLIANMATIEAWVYAGGRLFLNAAPNEGSSMNWGFGGATNVYPDYSPNAYAADPLHPIFLGPYSPVGTSWTGNYFGHSTVDVPCGWVLIDNGSESLLSEITWGLGMVMFGGMTVTSWHSPAPNASNLRKNIHSYLAFDEPFYITTYFTYPDSVYCKYEDNPLPVLDPTSDVGIFSATPAGLELDSITGEIDLAASTEGTYIITNTVTLGGCDYLSAFTLTVAPSPVADAGPDVYVCRGQSANFDGGGADTYMWTPPTYLDDPTLEDPLVTPLTNNYYQLIASDIYGCSDTDDAWVYLYPDPVIYAGEDVILMLGSEVELNATGGVTYTWTPVESLTNPDISNPIAFPEDTTMYVVTGTDANGCVSTDTVFVYVIEDSDIWSPTAFTPNGDGLNDTYKPGFIGIGTITDFSIYNRWGKLVYYSDDPEIGWDGTMNSQEQEIGTYVVVIKGATQFGDLVSKTTTVALLR